MPHLLKLSLSQTALLTRLQRIKAWLREHRKEQAVEYAVFDHVLTLWLMGWVGALPCLILALWWLLPLCVLAAHAPRMYLTARLRWHAQGHLRCDWAHLLN